MSAATVAREAIISPAPRVRQPRTSGQTRTTGRAQPMTGRARACTIPGASVSGGLSDRSLLAIMVAVSLVFLFGLVIMVQGFWVAGQAPGDSVQQSAVVTHG